MSHELIAEIERVVDAGGVLRGADLRGRAASALDPAPHRALALARPRSTAQLAEIMALCHRRGQPVAVQGGLTGLVDGGLAGEGELAISLERMSAIEAIDPDGRSLTAGAGATIEQIQAAAAERGLLFPVDWGARGSAMVGGAIATNAGGNAVLRYGMMREQVLGLEVVLADGRVLSSMNRLLKNNTGYDLKQLFIGSEGTLGIIARAVLRLRAAPRSWQTALLACDSFAKVVALLGHLDGGLAGALSAYELMWREHYELIVEEGGHREVLARGQPFYVLVEATGAEQRADERRFESLLAEAMDSGLIADAALCASGGQRAAVWAIRDDIDTLFRALHPCLALDISVPVGAMEGYVDSVRADMRASFPGIRGTAFGHLGDGNLHLCWQLPGDTPRHRAAVSRIAYDNLAPHGGSVSAEHGIGVAKREYLALSRNSEELEWMRRLKRLFDPSNLLNPGRVIDIGGQAPAPR